MLMYARARARVYVCGERESERERERESARARVCVCVCEQVHTHHKTMNKCEFRKLIQKSALALANTLLIIYFVRVSL